MPRTGDTDPIFTPKASVLHGAQDLRLEEQLVDPPGPFQLQIAVRSTGICGSDLHYHQHYRNGDLIVKEPLILGHESAGVVTDVGLHVKGFIIGDRVALEVGVPCTECSRCLEGRYNICPSLRFRSSAKSFPHYQGTLQDKLNHPAAWCYKLPENVSYELGAILEPLGVAMHATKRAQMQKGDSTLVIGAGAVGLLCAAMSKVAGSGKVVIADIQAKRVDFAVQNGYAHAGFVVPRKSGRDIDEKLEIARETARLATQMQITDGEPPHEYEMVFECTGVEACTQSAIYATRAGGKVIIVGMGSPIQTLPLSAASLREVDIIGTFRYAKTYPNAISLVASNNPLLPDLERLVTHRFHGLEHAPAAFDMAGNASDEQGKLVLKVVINMGEERFKI